GLAIHIETENTDRALLGRVEACDQAIERAFARAIEAEENAKAGGTHTKGNITQGLARAVAMAHAGDVQRGGYRAILLAARGGLIWRGKTHCGAITTPQGKEPAAIDFTTLRLATSITETSFETPLVVKRYLASGVNANCQTR